MSDKKTGDDWRPNASGVLLPPAEPRAEVVPVRFAVKVQGFAPTPEPEWKWQGLNATELTGYIIIRPTDTSRRTR